MVVILLNALVFMGSVGQAYVLRGNWGQSVLYA